MRRAWAAALVLAIGCTSAWNDTGPPPFTAAETNKALAPVPHLKARCYDGSQAKRQGKLARLTYVLYVQEDGRVHTEPIAAEPWDPELIDCMRRGLDEIKFPSKGETDQVRLEFELGGAS
jgi:hypothetical protein